MTSTPSGGPTPTAAPTPAAATVRLADLTTLRLGGPAERSLGAAHEAELIAAVRSVDADHGRLLLVGGGSNLVVGDAGWPGSVVLVRSRGVDARVDGDRVSVRVAAGEPWDELVERCVAEGWSGLECLAGVPGLAGATPVQNVGAYGQEVAETLIEVVVWDREQGQRRVLSPAECGFGYRTSRFKHTDRYVVTEVTFGLRRSTESEPVRYAELARTLGVEVGARVPLAAAREAVLGLRRGKGMVLDPADHDTWSAGSFFTNPIVEPGWVPDGAPAWPAGDGLVKTSAAWLIEHAGFAKGYSGTSGRSDGSDASSVSLSTKHTLALTNRGGATTADLLALAREVVAGVRAAFGIELVPEPTLVNCAV